MYVLKFGGTSVGSAERMLEVLDIITRDDSQKLVVLSAMSGTTNDLVKFNELCELQDTTALAEHLSNLKGRYRLVLSDLFEDGAMKERGQAVLDHTFSRLTEIAELPFASFLAKEVLAQGELLSTGLFTLLCEMNGHEVRITKLTTSSEEVVIIQRPYLVLL